MSSDGWDLSGVEDADAATAAAIDAMIRADLIEAIERDEWALILWGNNWDHCTPHQQAEALRLRGTPFGAGFEPRSDSGVLGE